MPDKKRKGSSKNLNKLSNAFQSFDLFGSGVNLRENGKEQFTTCFGAFISLLILIVVLDYATTKYTTLIEYGDTVHNSIVITEIEDVVPFSDHRFNFGAFYLRYEMIKDPSTGKSYTFKRDTKELFSFSAKAPTIDPTTGEKSSITLDVHQCTEQDSSFFSEGMERYKTEEDKIFNKAKKEIEMFCVSGMEQATLTSEISGKLQIVG